MDHDDNRRVAGKENGVVTRRYFWDGQLKIVAELDGSGNLVSQFVYGAHVNVPEYMVKGGATYRLITDQLGSVRLVVNTSTGAVAQRIEYDEFGVVTNDTNPGFQPFGFAGGLYDPDTKLTRFGARDYDAETGRWVSKDPILFSSLDTMVFGYSHSDSINYYDPSGLERCSLVDTLIGGVGPGVVSALAYKGILGAGLGAAGSGFGFGYALGMLLDDIFGSGDGKSLHEDLADWLLDNYDRWENGQPRRCFDRSLCIPRYSPDGGLVPSPYAIPDPSEGLPFYDGTPRYE